MKGSLHLNNWDNDARCLYDLDYPKNDKRITSLINFYQLTQFLPDFINNYKADSDHISDLNHINRINDLKSIKHLINEARTIQHRGVPILIVIDWNNYVPNEYSAYVRSQMAFEERVSDYQELIHNHYWMSEEGNIVDITSSIIEDDDSGLFKIKTPESEYVIRDDFTFSDNETENDYSVLPAIDKNGKNYYFYSVYTYSHALLIYGLSEGNYRINNDRIYKYCLPVYNPNLNKESFMYVSEDYTDWCYNDLSVNSSVDNTKYGVFKSSEGKESKMLEYVLSDCSTIDLINLESKINKTISKDYTGKYIDTYISQIESISSDDCSVRFCGLSYSGNMPIKMFTIPGYSGNRTMIWTTLPDSKDEYLIQAKNGDLHYRCILDNYLYIVKADDCVDSEISTSGWIRFNNNNGEYYYSVTYDEPLKNFKWSTVSVSGKGKCNSILKMVEDGAVLDNKNGFNSLVVEVDDSVEGCSATFSTDYPSVKFMAVDSDTLGVYVDKDGDGVYETLIADSDGTEYGSEKEPEESPGESKPDESSKSDKAESSVPADDNTDKESSAEQTGTIERIEGSSDTSSGTEASSASEGKSYGAASSPASEISQASAEPVSSADYGFVPFVSLTLAAAVAAAAIVLVLRKRSK